MSKPKIDDRLKKLNAISVEFKAMHFQCMVVKKLPPTLITAGALKVLTDETEILSCKIDQYLKVSQEILDRK